MMNKVPSPFASARRAQLTVRRQGDHWRENCNSRRLP
jgi:hypothetical protein